MKIALITASPKGKNSASQVLIDMLARKMQQDEILYIIWNTSESKEEDYKQLLACEVIVLAFPLYVDGIPSHLLRQLVAMEDYVKEQGVAPIIVYTMVNNGFYECWQNQPALDLIKNWCLHCGFTYGCGLGVGAGGMLQGIANIPDDVGPKKTVNQAMGKLAKRILQKEKGDDMMTTPKFPRWLYKLAAQSGWRHMIKQNGLKIRALKTKR